MLSLPRWITAAILMGGLLACQNGNHHRASGQRARARADSIERGYERLERAYEALPDSLSPPLREMVGAMRHMQGQMRRRHGHHQRGSRGQMHAQHRRRGGHRGAERREWHQQMMAMHAEMARLHAQSGQSELATRHEQMRRLHQNRMGTSDTEDRSTPSEPPDSRSVDIPDPGASLYDQHCASCHGAGGQGLGAFPPLTGTSWVTGEVEVPIRVLLHGLRGKIDVQGRSYDSMMPAFGSRLRDEEIAAILSYIRASWGNRAGPVAAKKVRALRNQFAARTQPWRAEELEAPEP